MVVRATATRPRRSSRLTLAGHQNHLRSTEAARISEPLNGQHCQQFAQTKGAALVAVGRELVGVSSAVMRRIPNHTAPTTDVLQRHYVTL